MERAGVFLACLLISYVAAWYHYSVTMIGAALIAMFAVTAVFRKLQRDLFVTHAFEEIAGGAPIGTPSDHAAAVSASARGLSATSTVSGNVTKT
jgi:hypothetical protein